ncbi:hypothetical protein GCM10022294_32470 [Dietzia aurantiaca]
MHGPLWDPVDPVDPAEPLDPGSPAEPSEPEDWAAAVTGATRDTDMTATGTVRSSELIAERRRIRGSLGEVVIGVHIDGSLTLQAC